MKAFHQLVANTFISVTTISMTWFALSLWVYTMTRSVLATSIMSGIYMLTTAVTGMWFGSLVDHHKKKHMMLISNAITFVAFGFAFMMYAFFPHELFKDHFSPYLWLFVSTIFVGVIASNIRNIALPTVTSILVPEQDRDKANGLSGTITGMSFVIASIVSGFFLASSGMYWILVGGMGLLVLSMFHLTTIDVPEKEVVHIEGQPTQKFNPRETFQEIKKIPGLLGLILFTTFNNFLGGAFMPLMDPYGLSLVSLKVWGVMWGFLSLGFMFGGIYIAKYGLGKSPLRTLFSINIALWTICMFFTIQPSIVLLAVGIFLYICLVPFIEASEQTIIQKIVPKERQGRVFGFAQSLESSASPLTAFVIGPIAQFIFIPFMTTGAGVDLIGSWFGTGEGRGIALVFTLIGVVGLCVTMLAMQSSAYKLLTARYKSEE